MQWRNFAVGSGGVYGVMMTLFLQWRDFAVETFCSGGGYCSGGVLQWGSCTVLRQLFSMPDVESLQLCLQS
jgi:hypothetical protein